MRCVGGRKRVLLHRMSICFTFTHDCNRNKKGGNILIRFLKKVIEVREIEFTEYFDFNSSK